MRLTLFWRVLLGQSALIALVLIVGLYALSALDWLSRLDTSILTTDSACINEEKRLLKIFFAEMRNGEKYLVLRDKAFYDSFVQEGADFVETLAKIASLTDTQREKVLVEEIGNLHSLYGAELGLSSAREGTGAQVKPQIGDGIIERANELLRLREQAVSDKTASARDHAVEAARVIGWLILGGVVAALLLAFFHARGVSAPLKKLAKEMRYVGKGEFSRSLDFKASKEVHALALAFNRMAEELAELDKLKADFTAHVSHELRTPLTAIREGTALLLEEIPGPLVSAQREILEVVHNHCERLFHSISSILDLSKMEAEMMEYEPTPCDLATLILGSVEDVRLIARSKEIDLEAEVPSSLPLLLLDERRVRQVLDNLLSNALRFTHEGGKVSVTARLKKSDGGAESHVEVRVSDTGQGIAAEDLERIFKRFYQGGRGSRRTGQGTGLGLAIARHVIEAHDGAIWAESRAGRGSTFVFTLPVPAGQQGPRRLKQEGGLLETTTSADRKYGTSF